MSIRKARNACAYSGSMPRFRKSPVRPPCHWWRHTSAVALVSLALGQVGPSASGQNSWNGVDGDWDVAANWSLGQVPDLTTDVLNAAASTITHGSAILTSSTVSSIAPVVA